MKHSSKILSGFLSGTLIVGSLAFGCGPAVTAEPAGDAPAAVAAQPKTASPVAVVNRKIRCQEL